MDPATQLSDHRPASDHRWRRTWLLDRRAFIALITCYAGFTALWVLVGVLLTDVFEGNAIVRGDERVSQWFADRRAPRLDDVSTVGSMLADTEVKVAVTTIVVFALFAILRRWKEPLVVAVSLILEAMVFITVTYLVARPRPDVPRLEGSPVDSSFPSGHVAAAVCYAAFGVVVFWHTRAIWIRVFTVLGICLVALAVALARLYAGMHYLSDVIAGVLLGAASVYATVIVIGRAEARHPDHSAMSAGEPAAELEEATWC